VVGPLFLLVILFLYISRKTKKIEEQKRTKEEDKIHASAVSIRMGAGFRQYFEVWQK
jgi:hypothetical protein